MISKAYRLQVFMKRLAALPAASTFAEAYTQLSDTMNAVEDELTSIPYNPATWATDGRMYPVQPDNFRAFNAGVTRLVSRGNNTYIADNGAISIWTRANETAPVCVFTKPGADGRTVDDLT